MMMMGMMRMMKMMLAMMTVMTMSMLTMMIVISVMMMILVILRVRAVFHKTVRVCHVYCNFNIGFTCQITIIFGTLKDGSLLINTLASNICF